MEIKMETCTAVSLKVDASYFSFPFLTIKLKVKKRLWDYETRDHQLYLVTFQFGPTVEMRL